MDWKPERAVQAKVRDSKTKKQKKNKAKKAEAWQSQVCQQRILCADLQIAASSKILINNGLYPQKVSTSRVLHRGRALPHQWFDQHILPHQWFNSGPHSRQWFDSSPVMLSQWRLPSVRTTMSVYFPTYLFCLVSSSSIVIYVVVQVVQFIHTFIHSLHTSIHACTSCVQHYSYLIALVTPSPVGFRPFSLTLSSCAK